MFASLSTHLIFALYCTIFLSLEFPLLSWAHSDLSVGVASPETLSAPIHESFLVCRKPARVRSHGGGKSRLKKVVMSTHTFFGYNREHYRIKVIQETSEITNTNALVKYLFFCRWGLSPMAKAEILGHVGLRFDFRWSRLVFLIYLGRFRYFFVSFLLEINKSWIHAQVLLVVQTVYISSL